MKEVKKELMNLSFKKATRKGNIPAKILKDSLKDNCLKDGLFPNELKLADVSPVFKKDDTRKTIDLSVCSDICQRFLKESSINKSIVL